MADKMTTSESLGRSTRIGEREMTEAKRAPERKADKEEEKEVELSKKDEESKKESVELSKKDVVQVTGVLRNNQVTSETIAGLISGVEKQIMNSFQNSDNLAAALKHLAAARQAIMVIEE